MKPQKTLLPLAFLACSTLSLGATRSVPSQYSTIQAAIDDCNDRDVVIVAPGTYTGDGNRDISFEGKAITVRSTEPNDPNIVARTVIDCRGTQTNPHRAFHFHNGEGKNSVVAGLTITNGYGPDAQVEQYISAGGAIYCNQSNPTIANCIITDNTAFMGAGLCNTASSSPIVTNCTFRDNSAWLAPPYGGGAGGGMLNYDSSPTVTACTFTGSRASHGGAMHNGGSSPTIADCLFTDNSTSHTGAGMHNRDGSNPTVSNCKFIRNSAGSSGGGIFNFTGSNPIVINCLFNDNSADEHGGGMCNDSSRSPSVVNCTFSGNSALRDGGGICDRRSSNPKLTNCIFWANRDSGGEDESAQVHKSDHGPVINYCCIQGLTGKLGGKGNISADPAFVHPTTGDYHLLPSSPCINAGDPNYAAAAGETDIDGDPRVLEGRIDMGIDEFTVTLAPIIGVSPKVFQFYAGKEAPQENQILTISNIGGYGTLYWSIREDCPWLEVYPKSGESTKDSDEVILSLDSSGMNSGFYSTELTIVAQGVVNSPQTIPATLQIYDDDGLLHVPSEYETVRAAIDTAINCETIIVAVGTYTGYGNRDLDFKGKAITIQSTDPLDSAVVKATVIDCQGNKTDPHRGFRFHGGEGPDSVVSGLTITNGYGPDEDVGYFTSAGGAIFCVESHPTITFCRIVGNQAGHKGGAIYCKRSSPTIANCTVGDNLADYGGAIYNCYDSNPTIINCTFTRNSAARRSLGIGGAIVNDGASNPTIAICSFIENRAESNGGAIYNGDYTKPIIANCMFNANDAYYNGGAIFNSWDSNPRVSSCVFIANLAGDKGGGIANSRCSPTITNCTFSRNSAKTSGHVMGNYYGGTGPTLINCILWGNTLAYQDQIALVEGSRVFIRYCNVQGGKAAIRAIERSWFDWGDGNSEIDPLLESDGYHLQPDSPCVNAGNPAYEPALAETDIDGEPRVMGGRVDIGADELTSTLIPILKISATKFEFSSYADGPNPDEQILSIRNIGSGTLEWTIAQDCPWLQVEPSNGESIGQINEVILRVDISGLGPGLYNCQLTITGEGAVSTPQVAALTLRLGGAEL